MKIINTENELEILATNNDLSKKLSDIGGKTFTRREVDIIACILHGRSVKKIAILLSISSKTVESHIRNIGLKVGLSNQESIIDFIEKSGKHGLLKQHYVNILIQRYFEAELKKIHESVNPEIKIRIVFDENTKKQFWGLIKQISDDLGLVGIYAELEPDNVGSQNISACIYCAFDNESEFRDPPGQLNHESLTTILCFNQAIADKIKNQNHKVKCLIISNFGSYYFLLFELLKVLLPKHNIDQNIVQFSKHIALLDTSLIEQQTTIKNEVKITKNIKQKNVLNRRFFYMAPAGLALVFVCFFIIKGMRARMENTKINFITNSSKSLSISEDVLGSLTWNLPFPNYYFTGRDKELKELSNNFANKQPGTATVALVACNGMGGVGKTEIAKYFIHNVEKLSNKKYRYKFWFDSEKVDKLIEQYIKLAKVLKIDLKDSDNEEIISKVTHWFNTHSDWLLVYDNAESMESIMRLLPQRGGDILITSRNPNWQTVVNINIMTESEAISLLKEIIKKPDNDKHIKSLVNTLGKLPLAVAQAGAYISRKGISVKSYLDEYEQEQHRLLIDNNMPPGTNHSSVSVTFSLSIESIKKISSDAYLLINCLAYLDPNAIYRKDLEVFMQNSSQAGKANIALNNAIQVLRDYSLISLNKNQTITIHRLVQAVTWYRQLHKHENNSWLYKVLEALNDDNNRENSQLALGIIGNKRECLEVLIAYYKNQLKSKKSPMLLQSLGCCYLAINDFKNAEKYFLESIALKKRSSIHCEYGMALYLQGKALAAIQQFEASLSVQDNYISYFGELERSSVDEVIKNLIDKYGIVRINSAHLSTYFLIRCYRELGDNAKANAYLKHLKKIAKKHQNPVLRDLIESIV